MKESKDTQMAMTETMALEAVILRNKLQRDAETSQKNADLIDGLLTEINQLTEKVEALEASVIPEPATDDSAPAEAFDEAALLEFPDTVNRLRGLPWQTGEMTVSSVGPKKNADYVDVILTLTQADAEFITNAPWYVKELALELRMARQDKWAKGKWADLDGIQASLDATSTNLLQFAVYGSYVDAIHQFMEEAVRAIPILIAELRVLRAKREAQIAKM
jgi:hypothetical protein